MEAGLKPARDLLICGVPNLQIFCAAQLKDDIQDLLRKETSPHNVIFPQQPAGSVLATAGTDPAMHDADVILGQPQASDVLKSDRLRWLHITSAGFTRYDTPEFRAEAKARGLMVTNSSEVYAESCAEHVFAFMLAQARQLPTALQSTCANGSEAWLQLRNTSSCLKNQEAVILGFGAIASRLIEMLAPFQMKITAMRRQPRGDEGIAVVTPENLAMALITADHVISILPENKASLRFISKERLQEMKHGSIFYNIGRGATVDQETLAASLHSSHLGAAWLDVTDPEPLPEDHPLRMAPRCFITPHTAGGHANESETLVRHFTPNFHRFLQHAPLHDRIM